MQGAVRLAIFKYYLNAHDRQRNALGVLLGHCRAQPCQCGGLEMAPRENKWSPLDGAHE